MAYTYDDFLKAAGTSGVMDRFSQDDLTVAQKNPEYGLSMVSLMKDISGAKNTEQRLLATEAANQLRKNYGVYGTGSTYANSHGSQINDLMGKVNNYGSFQYGNQDAYQQLLDSVANQEKFHYEVSEDPSFSAYKKAYLREGDRASANALAQASAASGGQASSYAVQAAQQANNYYAGQLADIIPTMQQNAYQQYLNDFSQKMNQLGALEDDRTFNYQSYLDQYQQLQNALANAQNQDATDYERYQDRVNNAMAMYQLLGYATPDVAEVLGIKTEPSSVVESGNPGTGPNPAPGNPGNPGEPVGDDKVVTNATGTDANSVEWVNVGGQFMDWSVLAQMIASGKVKEVYNPVTGKYTYQYVGNGNQSKNPGNRGTPSGGGSLNVVTAGSKSNTPYAVNDAGTRKQKSDRKALPMR